MSKGNELKPRIGFFGRRNVGKSTMINFLTGQQIAIVSDTAGTTTDPVRKSMEIGGIGPVVLVDTAGIDDEGELGALRVEKSMAALAEVDLALLLYTEGNYGEPEKRVARWCSEHGTPMLKVKTKAEPINKETLIAKIKEALPESAYRGRSLLGDIVNQGDTVILVTPIDSSAPEGRMILPQVQVLRDLMDLHAQAFFCQPEELPTTLAALKEPPALVVTDSQAFQRVNALTPEEVPLTSFSVVLARQKGLFSEYLEGTRMIGDLKDGDHVLLLESCTHNVTCEDIGRVKLPAALKKATCKSLQCEVIGGQSPLPKDLSQYALVIQCGGCVITAQQVKARLLPALEAGVPVSNYGLALAWCNGIFDRATRVFKAQLDCKRIKKMININKKPNLSIIVAMAENRAIGKDNDLLWHLSGDLKRFKKLTTGHPVVMGRRTWESLPKRPLPGRRNIVFTQNLDYVAEGAEVVHSVNDLFKALEDCEEEVFVMGGAAIYKLLLPFTNKLYVTRVYREFDGDVFFPTIDMSEFNLVSLGDPMFDEESGLDYAYEEYIRKFRK